MGKKIEYGFVTTWRWMNNYNIFIFNWTISLIRINVYFTGIKSIKRGLKKISTFSKMKEKIVFEYASINFVRWSESYSELITFWEAQNVFLKTLWLIYMTLLKITWGKNKNLKNCTDTVVLWNVKALFLCRSFCDVCKHWLL